MTAWWWSWHPGGPVVRGRWSCGCCQVSPGSSPWLSLHMLLVFKFGTRVCLLPCTSLGSFESWDVYINTLIEDVPRGTAEQSSHLSIAWKRQTSTWLEMSLVLKSSKPILVRCIFFRKFFLFRQEVKIHSLSFHNRAECRMQRGHTSEVSSLSTTGEWRCFCAFSVWVGSIVGGRV